MDSKEREIFNSRFQEAKSLLEKDIQKKNSKDEKEHLENIEKLKDEILDVDRLSKMRSGIHVRIPIEHDGITFVMRMLSIEDRLKADYLAMSEAKDGIEYSELWTARYLRYSMIYQLAIACDNMEGISASFFKKMSFESLDVLFMIYIDKCDMYNPQFDDLSDAKVEVLVEALKKQEILPKELSRYKLLRIIDFYMSKAIN